MTNRTPHFISLGAGVQSSVMALLAADGRIEPMPECAIFADTQAEPPSVYAWLERLRELLPFPIITETAGSLSKSATTVRVSAAGKSYLRNAIPAFVGDGGMLHRHCTRDFKVRPIMRAVRNYLREHEMPKAAVQWIGISIDEALRMKPSRDPWMLHRWPLVEMRMSRDDCQEYLRNRGLAAPRSACVFCPFHSDREWHRLKEDEPAAFRQAVEFELELQEAFAKSREKSATAWLHRSRRPLSEVDFTPNPTTQDGYSQGEFQWVNECEGMCGV